MAILKTKIIFGSNVVATGVDATLAITSEDGTDIYTSNLSNGNIDSSDNWAASAAGWQTINNIIWADTETDPDTGTVSNIPIAYSAQSVISSITGVSYSSYDISISIARDIETNEWEDADFPYGFSFSSDTETKYLKIIVTITQSEVIPTQREIEGIGLNVTIYPPVFRPQNINTITNKDKWLKYQKCFLQGIKTSEGTAITGVKSSLSYTIQKTDETSKTHNLYYNNQNKENEFFTILPKDGNTVYDTIFNNNSTPTRGLNLQIPLFGSTYQIDSNGTITIPAGTDDEFLKSENEYFVSLKFNYGYYDTNGYVTVKTSQIIIGSDVNKYVSIESLSNRILPNVPIMQLKKRGVRFNTPVWDNTYQTADVMINHSNLNSGGDSLALYDYRTVTVNNEESISNKPSLAFYGYDPSLLTDQTVNYNPHRWSTKLTSYYWDKNRTTFLLQNRGPVIIGGGESGQNYFNYLWKEENQTNLKNGEWLGLIADSSVYIMANMQNVYTLDEYNNFEPASEDWRARVWKFGVDGEIYAPLDKRGYINQVVTTGGGGTYGRIWTGSSERVGVTVTGSNKIRYDGIFGPDSIILKNNTTNTKIWEIYSSKIVGGNHTKTNFTSGSTWQDTGLSFSLAPGKWVISCSVRFASNSSGIRQVIITDSSNNQHEYSRVLTSASSSGQTMINTVGIVSHSSQTTYKVRATQNSGSTLEVIAYYRAVRVG